MAVGTSVYTVMIETHLWTNGPKTTDPMLTQPTTLGTRPRTWQRKYARCVPDLVTSKTRPGIHNVGQSCQRENTFLLVHEKLRARPSETEIYDLKHHWTCKNNHGDCHPSSRCKTDVNYEPSKTIIKDSNAELLLRKVLEKTLIYKSPGDLFLCMDTYLVERFINSMLQYHDERPGNHFGDKPQVSDRLVRSCLERPCKQQASDFNEASKWSENSTPSECYQEAGGQ